jgi:hypothetical protein
MGSSAPRWSFCQEDQDGHVDKIIMVKSGCFGWYEKANWSDLVIGHIADSAALTGLTFHPHRSDRSDQSAQNANWTSPLRKPRQVDRNAYVGHPVRSPYEGVMVLVRTNPAPWPVWPMGPDGLIGARSQIRVRSCISTRDLYKFRFLLGQDLPTLYLWRATVDLGGDNRIYQLHLLFTLSTPVSNLHASRLLISTTWDGVLGLLVSWSPWLEMAS